MSLLLLLTPDRPQPGDPVGVELGALAWIRSRYVDSSFAFASSGASVAPPAPLPALPEAFTLLRRPIVDSSVALGPTPSDVVAPTRIAGSALPDVSTFRRASLPELGLAAPAARANNDQGGREVHGEPATYSRKRPQVVDWQASPQPPAGYPALGRADQDALGQLARKLLPADWTQGPRPADNNPAALPLPELARDLDYRSRKPLPADWTQGPRPADAVATGIAGSTLGEIVPRRPLPIDWQRSPLASNAFPALGASIPDALGAYARRPFLADWQRSPLAANGYPALGSSVPDSLGLYARKPTPIDWQRSPAPAANNPPAIPLPELARDGHFYARKPAPADWQRSPAPASVTAAPFEPHDGMVGRPLPRRSEPRPLPLPKLRVLEDGVIDFERRKALIDAMRAHEELRQAEEDEIVALLFALGLL